MGLYQKYRPKEFEEVVGNQELVESLESVLAKKSIPHAFLFHGPSGCGKTTLARIVAEKLGCHVNDIMELNMSDMRGIDTGRSIMKEMVYKPLKGSVKVYLLDEVHQATKDFQNAMLKALEDTPAHVYFLLCTTDPSKLLETVRNRCVRFELRPLAEAKLASLVTGVSTKEGKQVHRQVAFKIAEAAQGCPRESLTILDSVIDLDSKEKQMAAVSKYEAGAKEVIDLCRALIKGKTWKVVSPILQGLGEDPEKVRRAVLGYMNSILLKEDNATAATIISYFSDNFYDSGKAGLTLACYSVIAGE